MTGAVQRQPEPEPGPPGRSDLRAKMDAVLDGNLGLISRIDATLGELRANGVIDACPAVEGQLQWLITETVRAGLHVEEARGDLAAFTARDCQERLIWEDGRQHGYAQRDAEIAATTPLRPRHARSRTSHLKLAGVAAAFTAATAGGTAATMMTDSAFARHASAPSPAAVLRHMPADTAIPITFPSSPRPTTAVRTAKPVVTPSPSPSSPPPPSPSPSSPPPPAPPAPALTVSVRDLQLSGPAGTFTLSATTEQGVNWSVSTDIPGATLSVAQGVLTSAQAPQQITITDPLGQGGWVYVKWDNGGIATVWVTSSVGLPSLP